MNLALLSVVSFAAAMRLAPLLDFTVWGSDWGEYYYLSQGLVDTGHHMSKSLGWGKAYVDFPGLFDLTGVISLVLGTSVNGAMNLVVPCVSAVSCLVVASIVLRVGGDPWAALFSAAVLAVIFPEVYQNSHPVPGSIGSMMTMAILLVFVLGDSWRRDEDVDAGRPPALYILFLVLTLALVVTHHLSLFFALLVVGMAYLVRSWVVRGEEVQRTAWGLFALVAVFAAITIYWLGLAPVFRDEVMIDMFGVPGWVPLALVWSGLIPFLLITRYLSRRDKDLVDPPYWGPSVLRAFVLIYIMGAVLVIALVATFGYPGTDIQPGTLMVLYVLPTALAFTAMVGSSDLVNRAHGGHVVSSWMAALVLSFLFATALASRVLVPYRHLPFIVEVGAILLGVGLVHLRRMTLPRGKAWSGGTGLVATVLLVLLVFTAYPPKEVMGGFQEGTTQGEMSAALWLRGGVPGPGARPVDEGSGAVATDHRMSSMTFGVGRQMATWDEAGEVLHGEGGPAMEGALEGVDTPQGVKPISAVLLTSDFRTGAALHQWDTASPMDGEAWNKFFRHPYIPLYNGGDVWVMGVVRPLANG